MDIFKQFNTQKLTNLMTRTVLIGLCLTSTMTYADRDGQDSGETLHTISELSLNLANKAAMAAFRKCRRDGYAVSVAVVDRSGVIISHVRNPKAGPHTVNSSLGKAFTSASMGRATSGLADAIATNPALEGLRDMDSRMVILAGGLPIMFNGTRVGGIGVGGAPGGQLDEACAGFGLQKIGAQ